MKKTATYSQENPVIRFFSSVHLAIFLLIALAVTSIIGTIIPQGQSQQFYLDNFGPTMSKLTKILHLNDTYHSWWYLSLLALFSTNLIVCTLKRLPFTLKLFKKDNLAVSSDYLTRMPYKRIWRVKDGVLDNELMQKLLSTFQKKAGSFQKKPNVDGGTLFLVEKGKWSYWGLYGVHLSILIIFLGAVFGSFYGFKGRIMLMEGETTDHAVRFDTAAPIPLGFSIRCDHFFVSFYDNGAPKEFRSDLTILEKGKEVLHKAILVNDPLEYKGVTFYQASYQAIPEVTIRVASSTGIQRSFIIPAFQKVSWPESSMTLALLKYIPNIHGVPAARIWIGDGTGQGHALWVLQGRTEKYTRGDTTYELSLVSASERYMTGLQVKKDPGVWIVWLGCTALILGFAIVFWVPHRRSWLWVGPKDGETQVILSGQTNKNKIHFEKDFRELEDSINSVLGNQ